MYIYIYIHTNTVDRNVRFVDLHDFLFRTVLFQMFPVRICSFFSCSSPDPFCFLDCSFSELSVIRLFLFRVVFFQFLPFQNCLFSDMSVSEFPFKLFPFLKFALFRKSCCSKLFIFRSSCS